MRLSELLHSEVFDADGRHYGTVDDVRMVQDGPVLGTFGAALRVDGIVIGRGGLGVRLGFHRTRVRGPWLLNTIFGRLERRAKFVPWDKVQSYDAGRIVFAGQPEAVPAGD